MNQFPIGFNWQCPLCGTFASVAEIDLPNYVCPKCKGGGIMPPVMKSITINLAKAVEVPKYLSPEGPLRFKDPRFEVRVKKSDADEGAIMAGDDDLPGNAISGEKVEAGEAIEAGEITFASERYKKGKRKAKLE